MKKKKTTRCDAKTKAGKKCKNRTNVLLPIAKYATKRRCGSPANEWWYQYRCHVHRII